MRQNYSQEIFRFTHNVPHRHPIARPHPHPHPQPLASINNHSLSKISVIRDPSRKRSPSKGPFGCDPSHLKQLKHLLDGIMDSYVQDTSKISKGLSHMRNVHSKGAEQGVNRREEEAKRREQEASMEREREKFCAKGSKLRSTTDKLQELKQFIDKVVVYNQGENSHSQARLTATKNTQEQLLAMEGSECNLEESAKRVSNSFSPSRNTSLMQKLKRDGVSPRKRDISSRKEVFPDHNQITRLREQNIQLQTWLNEEIRKNIELEKPPMKPRKDSLNQNESIINRLKRDDHSLQLENNQLRAYIKTLEMEILNFEEGIAINPQGETITKLRNDILERDQKILRLEEEVKTSHGDPSRTFEGENKQKSTIVGLMSQVQHLQKRLKYSKRDPSLDTFKKEIHRLKTENQHLKINAISSEKHSELGNAYKNMQALRKENKQLNEHLRNEEAVSRHQKRNQEGERPSSQVANHHHSPSVQNLFHLNRSHQSRKHSRTETQIVSLDHSRPRVQILHQELKCQ